MALPKLPLIIDIIQRTHIHTATIYDFASLTNYIRGIHNSGKKWKFGTIHDYGSFDVMEIVNAMNSHKCWSSFDKHV